MYVLEYKVLLISVGTRISRLAELYSTESTAVHLTLLWINFANLLFTVVTNKLCLGQYAVSFSHKN